MTRFIEVCPICDTGEAVECCTECGDYVCPNCYVMTARKKAVCTDCVQKTDADD